MSDICELILFEDICHYNNEILHFFTGEGCLHLKWPPGSLTQSTRSITDLLVHVPIPSSKMFFVHNIQLSILSRIFFFFFFFFFFFWFIPQHVVNKVYVSINIIRNKQQRPRLRTQWFKRFLHHCVLIMVVYDTYPWFLPILSINTSLISSYTNEQGPSLRHTACPFVGDNQNRLRTT